MYHIRENSGFWGSLTVANLKLSKRNSGCHVQVQPQARVEYESRSLSRRLMTPGGVRNLWAEVAGVWVVCQSWQGSHAGARILPRPQKLFPELYFVVVGFDHPPHHLHLLHECFTCTNMSEWVSEFWTVPDLNAKNSCKVMVFWDVRWCDVVWVRKN